MSQPPRIYQVAVPAPLYQVFDYLACDHAPDAPIGARVRVPFGRRSAVGVVLGASERSELAPGRLKSVVAVLDDEPLLPPALIKLLNWAASYYRHPVGEVFQAALPV